MLKTATTPYLIEILKDGEWLVSGSSKRVQSDCKSIRGDAYRIVLRTPLTTSTISATYTRG